MDAQGKGYQDYLDGTDMPTIVLGTGVEVPEMQVFTRRRQPALTLRLKLLVYEALSYTCTRP